MTLSEKKSLRTSILWLDINPFMLGLELLAVVNKREQFRSQIIGQDKYNFIDNIKFCLGFLLCHEVLSPAPSELPQFVTIGDDPR